MNRQALHISSSSNARFKFLLSLDKPKVRRQEGLSSVEGIKEIEMALEGGVEFRSLFYLPEVADKHLLNTICNAFPNIELLEISKELYAKTAYRESSGGMVAVVHCPNKSLSNLKVPEGALILVISGVEKPGNLGAMLRTADAAAVDAVICCDLPGDLYNPNTIRASLGTVFTVPVAVATSVEAMQWLKANGICTFCSNLHKADNYYAFDYTQSSAIVMGTESTGVSDAWIQFADHQVKVPMLGKIDSMNVSVAAAVMVYEARRQRLAVSH